MNLEIRLKLIDCWRLYLILFPCQISYFHSIYSTFFITLESKYYFINRDLLLVNRDHFLFIIFIFILFCFRFWFYFKFKLIQFSIIKKNLKSFRSRNATKLNTLFDSRVNIFPFYCKCSVCHKKWLILNEHDKMKLTHTSIKYYVNWNSFFFLSKK